ncbi:hypothetical protein BVC71_02750 [Marivivens niveibacter]|uniref:Uncharacterized protein n=2 Tax=Marivivens niveibacter TaxID=1930667 RepID=A0A251X225_9RHOB|nr:hypothetical protein BVC71_02750 [Marivivens niveibacter]
MLAKLTELLSDRIGSINQRPDILFPKNFAVSPKKQFVMRVRATFICFKSNNEGTGMTIRFTTFTSEAPKRLTKHITLQDGALVTEAGGYMTRGMYVVDECANISEFGDHIASLRTNQALSYGLPKGAEMGMVVTRAVYEALPVEQREGRIARINDHFEWPDGPGIFMIDIDPPKDASALTKSEAINLIRGVAPELKDVPMLWYPSSSSMIYADDGTEMSGLRGQRFYVPVTDAKQIPEFAEHLWVRCWAAGHGYIAISKSGSILKRTIFDKSVYQPSRLDFAAGASTGPHLIQRRGQPEVV